MLPSSMTQKKLFSLREEREKPQEFSPWKSRVEKKRQEKSCCYQPGFCLLYWKTTYQTVHELLINTVIAPSPNLISVANGTQCWLEEQCGWLPLECFTRVFLLNSHTCAPQGRFRRGPRLGASGAGVLTHQRSTSAMTACPFASAEKNSCFTLHGLCLWPMVVKVTSAMSGWREVPLSHQQILC